MKCDVCGKEMTMPDDEFSFVGAEIGVQVKENVSPEQVAWMAEQMKPYKVNRQYYVC